MANKHPVDVRLLRSQEDYFWYVKQGFMYLETAYRTWDQTQARGASAGRSNFVYPKPPQIPRMSNENLISASPAFYSAVDALRELEPPYMVMALWAAMVWDPERLKEAKAAGDIPGDDAALSRQRIVN